MNMIDLLALIPFYVSLFLDQMDDVYMLGKTGKIIRLVRVLRIMRIFKLVRHFAGLQSLAQTMREAYKELGLLLMLVTFSAFIFAIVVYFALKKWNNFSNNGGHHKVMMIVIFPRFERLVQAVSVLLQWTTLDSVMKK